MFWLPVSLDTLALLTLVSSYTLTATLYPLNLMGASFLALGCYVFMIYSRATQARLGQVALGRFLSPQTTAYPLSRYLLILFLASLYTIVIQTTVPAIIPPLIHSLLTLFAITAQYYALTLLVTHLGLRAFLRWIRREDLGIPHLLRKLLLGQKTTLTTWSHSMVLLTWAVTIIWTSTHSFTINYTLHQEMADPTELRVQVGGLTLHNVSTLETLPEIQTVIPLSHSQETFFALYDLYLFDIPKLHTTRPDLFSLTGIRQVLPNHAYMASTMAKTLQFQEGDLFPIKFGHNQTAPVIEKQPIIITDYFPLIKPLDNRPFIVTSYLHKYENVTTVNELLITLKEGAEATAALTTLKQALGPHFLASVPPLLQLPYNPITRLYQAFFLAYALINTTLCFHRLTQDLAPSLKQISVRGMTPPRARWGPHPGGRADYHHLVHDECAPRKPLCLLSTASNHLFYDPALHSGSSEARTGYPNQYPHSLRPPGAAPRQIPGRQQVTALSPVAKGESVV